MARQSKNSFGVQEGFSKPPRGGIGVKKSTVATVEDDDLFSYGSSKPKPGYQNGYDDVTQDEEIVNQAVQDLERHAVKKSQETTSTLKNCLRVAEDTMGVGAQTLISLHDQGIQIERIHERAVDLDQHLSRGEKTLGSLGGIYSKPWRPQKRKITGPAVGRVDKNQKESAQDREALGVNGSQEKKTGSYHDTNTLEGRMTAERETQDDMLDELSTAVSLIKDLSMDLRAEIDRQAPAIDDLYGDVSKLNDGIQRANARGQRLLGR